MCSSSNRKPCITKAVVHLNTLLCRPTTGHYRKWYNDHAVMRSVITRESPRLVWHEYQCLSLPPPASQPASQVGSPLTARGIPDRRRQKMYEDVLVQGCGDVWIKHQQLASIIFTFRDKKNISMFSTLAMRSTNYCTNVQYIHCIMEQQILNLSAKSQKPVNYFFLALQ